MIAEIMQHYPHLMRAVNRWEREIDRAEAHDWPEHGELAYDYRHAVMGEMVTPEAASQVALRGVYVP